MFRFVLQVAFIRRVLQLSFIKLALLVIMFCALFAGIIYAVAVFHAVNQRNGFHYVHAHSN
jgi:hypothetical protein